MYLGELDEALALLDRARAVAERREFADVDRAEVLYRLGCARLKRSDVALAVSLFTVALELCDKSSEGCDGLRSHVLEWRSRAYQMRRDWDAARTDVEHALELAQARDDEHTTAHLLFQASLIAERTDQTLLACCYAEQGKEIYERLDDRPNVGRLSNNLGGLRFLLGQTEEAVAHLTSAISIALELDNCADAAQAISSLAQVHLRTGEPELAEKHARHALELLAGRDDFIDEIGNAQLVLGRALADRGSFDEAEGWLCAAESSFERRASTSKRAAAWVAKGDLARRRGDCERAADLYRASTELLQDFHF
jgi:tetratricopeptide (TPR) repeat protein